IFNSYSIDTQMLLRISVLLGRDFFVLYSAALREESESTLRSCLKMNQKVFYVDQKKYINN
ncbi:MAG: hypothetical protein AUK63_2184, partial [bacterium P3]